MTAKQPARAVQAKQLGQWQVVGWLGGGAAGDVFEARNGNEDRAAVKVFHRDRRSKVVERFQKEIDFLQAHPDYPGILPVVDTYLGEGADRSFWCASPLATPFTKEDSFRTDPYDLIRAVATIAATLADLALQGIHHRNLRPSNLFLLDGKAVAGDFELLRPDDAVDLTRKRDQVSVTYRAPETNTHGPSADPEKADVYSLAMSLSDLLATRVRDIAGLDAMLKEALNLDPKARPNMARFGGELSDLCDRVEVVVLPDAAPELDRAAGRLRRLLADESNDETRRAELTRQARLTYAALVASTLGVARTSMALLPSLRVAEIELTDDQIEIPARRAFMLHRGANSITATVPGAVLTVSVHAGFWEGIQSELLKVSVQREWGEAKVTMTVKWIEAEKETDVWHFGWQQTLRAARSARSFSELSLQTSRHLTTAYELLANWVEHREMPNFD